ncbi:glycogen/starch synthase [Pedobacter sp. MC2016-14]|uniref:glycogen/starch synthase n=1 Tax=Pedobacter sp. MC2016-14 TaxID=2897327 RepID=UPI001E2D5E51|nr:glycogen/starch synthase [Pedobacter sp. MC2016-14]MCD0487445.1 glycogen/starch synthase [Pedobacter sp. MC2016-14]
MAKTKLLIVTHEMSPFLELTKISEITRQLPQAMQEKGFEIRILMPRFGNINERRNRLHEVIRLSGMNIIIDDNDNPLIIKVASIPAARMQVYFLDNEDYFQRKYVFRDKESKFYDDNDERMIFFCKGALETVKKLGWAPDIVHCHGWMTALIPAYIKTTYKNDPTFKNSKVMYSIYDNCFTETLNVDLHKKAIMPGMTAEHTKIFEKADCNALHMGAVTYSDAIALAGEHIDDAMLKFVKDSNKPTLAYNLTENFENFYSMYEEISNEELVSIA